MIEISCPTEGDTRAAAGRLASQCRPGDIVILSGTLGSGKTTFAGGLAEGLGVEETVTSPSFVIMRRYDSGFVPFVHVDVYRLGSMGEFDDLDIFEEGRGGVVVIEWGEAVLPSLPEDHLHVEISTVGDGRVVRLTPSGAWNARRLDDVAGS